MKLIDGKQIAKSIYTDIKANLGGVGDKANSNQDIEAKNHLPKLHIFIATDDESAFTYSELKVAKAAELGMTAQIHTYPKIDDANSTQNQAKEIIEKIVKLAEESHLNGIMVQLPLFNDLAPFQNQILNSIPAAQDVDGLGAKNLGLTAQNDERAIWPATVSAVWKAMQSYQPDATQLKGKHAVIVNHSNVVGKPLAQVLLAHEMTVTTCHEHTIDLARYTTAADYLITATGQPHLLNHTHIKPGAVVVDVTSIKTNHGVLGDIEVTPELDNKIAARTPVPGGIGPLTVACLMQNLAVLSGIE